MAKLEKAIKRERKNHKARTGMRVSGRSVFVIQATLIKKGSKYMLGSCQADWLDEAYSNADRFDFWKERQRERELDDYLNCDFEE